MRSRPASTARAPWLAIILLASAPPINAGRWDAIDDDEPRLSSGIYTQYCGPHCLCLKDAALGHSYCGDCTEGHRPPPGHLWNCLDQCTPSCKKCGDGGCLECANGYTSAPFDSGACVLDYNLLISAAQRSEHGRRVEYTEEDSEYSPSFTVGFMPMALLALVVISAVVRRVLRRAAPAPVPVSGPVLMGVVNGEWETAPLVPQQAVQDGRATLGNSVLVVGPEGNIEMGVADNTECAEDGNEEA